MGSFDVSNPHQVNHSTTAQDWPNGTKYPMHHFLSNSQFSSTHSAYLANITTTKEPHTYAQAILDPNWQKAMDEEFFALQLNQTWTLTPLPVGQKPIGCKWVYKIKYNSDASVDRYKARLVTNSKINNFEVSPHHCSSQKLVYSPARCAKCFLTWHIA